MAGVVIYFQMMKMLNIVMKSMFIDFPEFQVFISHSTSHIEGFWGTLKDYIRKMYTKIPSKNFILYLPEAEIPYIMRDYSIKEKENKLIEIFEYLYNIVNYELYDLDEIEEPYAYDY